jgi:hypothetical protein
MTQHISRCHCTTIFCRSQAEVTLFFQTRLLGKNDIFQNSGEERKKDINKNPFFIFIIYIYIIGGNDRACGYVDKIKIFIIYNALQAVFGVHKLCITLWIKLNNFLTCRFFLTYPQSIHRISPGQLPEDIHRLGVFNIEVFP